jgi:hypothetical protein
VDDSGRRVLVGLTFEETREFESLDHSSLTRERTELVPGDQDAATTAHEQRWTALYSRHHSAWRIWMDQSRDENVRRAGASNVTG